jgi:glycine oxidase
MSSCLVIGGGVIGLSLAYELAGQGRTVRVIDAGEPGREASWAGAGILPPAGEGTPDPLEQLTALSNRLHARWADALRDSTGVDNGFRRTGAIYLSRGQAQTRALEQSVQWAHGRGIVAERLTAESLGELEPALRLTGSPRCAYLVPGECQLRNPRHLKALVAGCAQRGVEMTRGVAADDFVVRGDRVRSVRTNLGPIAAEQFCITTGAWSAALASRLGVAAQIRPIRGQIVLLATGRQVIARIINQGPRYLVPRPDGRVLVGSTEEDVGFDRSTTVGAVAELLEFALGLVPELQQAQLERSWAGLRPATRDGLPYLGRVPGLANAFLAAGHFRSGLQLSTGTAVVMSQLMEGRQPAVDLSAFRLDREVGDVVTGDRPRSRREVSLQ